jgi:hypothetical protein
MSMVTEYFIEVLGVVFERSFDIVNNVRSNAIPELLRGYVGIF